MNSPSRQAEDHANQRPEDAPFLVDMCGLARQNTSFTFSSHRNQHGEIAYRLGCQRGPIDHKVLARCLAGITSAIYYVTGPPGMVKGLRMSLKAPGLMTTMSTQKSTPATETKADALFGKAKSGNRNRYGTRGSWCDSPSTGLLRGDHSKAKRSEDRAN